MKVDGIFSMHSTEIKLLIIFIEDQRSFTFTAMMMIWTLYNQRLISYAIVKKDYVQAYGFHNLAMILNIRY